MNHTTPQSVPWATSRRSRRRARRPVALVGAALGVAVLAGACRPGPGPAPSTTTPAPTTTTPGPGPQPGRCRTIDFAKATVAQVPSTATVPRYRLTVEGTKPSISQTVTLEPLTYVQQPEYWAIEVRACDPPGAGLPATGPYTATLDLTGVLGTRGIEVVGASGSQRIDVDGGLRPPGRPRLAGTSWVLDPASLGVPVPAGSSVTAAFSETGVSGTSACNRYNGSYAATGTSLTFGPIATTRMACAPPVMAAESAYLARLAAVTGFEVTASSLVLTGGRGALRFVPAR